MKTMPHVNLGKWRKPGVEPLFGSNTRSKMKVSQRIKFMQVFGTNLWFPQGITITLANGTK